MHQPVAIGGSGSTYVWGHIDAAYRPNMNKEETVDFVKNSKCYLLQAYFDWTSLISMPVKNFSLSKIVSCKLINLKTNTTTQHNLNILLIIIQAICAEDLPTV